MTESPQIAMGTAFIAGAWGHALKIQPFQDCKKF